MYVYGLSVVMFLMCSIPKCSSMLFHVFCACMCRTMFIGGSCAMSCNVSYACLSSKVWFVMKRVALFCTDCIFDIDVFGAM